MPNAGSSVRHETFRESWSVPQVTGGQHLGVPLRPTSRRTRPQAIAIVVGLVLWGPCSGIAASGQNGQDAAAVVQQSGLGEPDGLVLVDNLPQPTLEQTEEYINNDLNINGSSFDYGFRSQWERFGFFQQCVLTISSIQTSPGDTLESTAVIDLHHLANPNRYDSAITIRSFDGGSQFITVTKNWAKATNPNEVIHVNNISIGMNDPAVAARLAKAVSHLERLCGSTPVYDPFAIK
jgi:hypothetical protein